jgi:hypothetical protein
MWRIDRDGHVFGDMVEKASAAVRSAEPGLRQVLGRISPIDPELIRLMGSRGVLDGLDAVPLMPQSCGVASHPTSSRLVGESAAFCVRRVERYVP